MLFSNGDCNIRDKLLSTQLVNPRSDRGLDQLLYANGADNGVFGKDFSVNDAVIAYVKEKKSLTLVSMILCAWQKSIASRDDCGKIAVIYLELLAGNMAAVMYK